MIITTAFRSYGSLWSGVGTAGLSGFAHHGMSTLSLDVATYTRDAIYVFTEVIIIEPIVALYMLSAIDVLTLSGEEKIIPDLWDGMDI